MLQRVLANRRTASGPGTGDSSFTSNGPPRQIGHPPGNRPIPVIYRRRSKHVGKLANSPGTASHRVPWCRILHHGEDGHPLAILMLAMHKARLPSRGFRRLRQELGNFFQLRHSPPGQLAGELRRTRADGARPPGSKKVANWQTQFFFGRSLHCRMPLRRQLSLPTVANSTGKLANSFRASSAGCLGS